MREQKERDTYADAVREADVAEMPEHMADLMPSASPGGGAADKK